MVKKLIHIILVIFLAACDFGDINVDPARLTDVTVDLILPNAQAQTARNMGAIAARVTGTVIGQFKGIDAQPLSYNIYLIDENTMDDLWRSGLYGGAMKDCWDIMNRGETKNMPHYVGIAKVLMAINLGIATSLWGDVPYTEAFQGQDNLKTAYDTQEAIYDEIFTLLDEAIDHLNQPAGNISPSNDDLIYAGNPALWIGTARALKARYYLHMSNRDSQAAQKAINALNSGSIFSNAVEPTFNFGITQNEAHPLAYFCNDRQDQLVMGDYILGLLNATNDPRKNIYASLGDGGYELYQIINTSLYWGQFDSPMPLISYAEILFIKSEANLRLGDVAKADILFQQAITANMQQLGVSTGNTTNYINTIGSLLISTSFEERLQKLMLQKYLALFVQGTLEAWNDYRRTGYPVLQVPSNVSTSFNPSKVIPQRYLYPYSERTTNSENRQVAIDNQGSHLMDMPLWVFAK